MKKSIAFLSVAAAAMMAAGTASAQSGYVGLSYNESGSDFTSYGIDGSVAFGSNFQLDAGYRDFEDVNGEALSVGGHFFNRGETWLVGGYVGYDVISGSGDDIDEWTVAGQAQYYADQTTLSADLSYSQLSDFLFVTDVTVTQLNGEAKFFQTENLSFALSAGLGQADSDFGDSNFYSFGGGAEWQLAAAPVSLFADVRTIGSSDDSTETSTGWRIGARMNFGGSLLDRNRSGAGLSQPGGYLDLLF